jgi:hypothetical protein
VLVMVSRLVIYFFAARKPLVFRSFISIGAFIIFEYIATPQMNLDLLPSFALVSVIPYTVFLPFEVFNKAIILTWFSLESLANPRIPQGFCACETSVCRLYTCYSLDSRNLTL